MRKLKELIAGQQLSQRALAADIGISPAALCTLVNHRRLPRTGWAQARAKLESVLLHMGTNPADIAAALAELDAPITTIEPSKEEPSMIIRKQTLSMRTRQHFKLARNPFGDPQSPEDVYLSPEARYVREAMYDAAINGNFLAVVGDSGSGKSTLREELAERLKVEGDSVIMIEPYTLSMADSDKVGKLLRAPHIAEAVISTVSPGASVPLSPEMRARKLHHILRESSRTGFKHLLIIEEAHDLHMHTLKALKRFWELKDGLKRLLSIILIGQTELMNKLGSKQSDVREVVQRCDVVQLAPVKDPSDFLSHRFSRVDTELASVFMPDALEELRQRLIVACDLRGNSVYMGYPLAISNLAIAAMNTAAQLGERQVTADVVRQVQP